MPPFGKADPAAGGEGYLETPDHDLAWWQRSMADVYACVAVFAAAVLALLGWILRMLTAQAQRLLGRRSSLKAKVL